jgi:hypothetical protein
MTTAHGGAMITKIIPLTQGKQAIVDDEDFEELSKHKWYYVSGIGYAGRNSKDKDNRRTILMHREILHTPQGMCTDHANGDKLDNRKINLRICNSSQNKSNQGLQHHNKSGYKGVCWMVRSKRWEASIYHNGKRIYLGQYRNIVDAARSYDNAALKAWGEFALLNIPGDKTCHR